MYNNKSGTLSIKVVSAQLKKNKDFILKQDPYCILRFEGQTFKTKTHRFGGKTPSWSEVFTMKKTSGDLLEISVYDEDLLTSDDFLGAAHISINKLLDQNQLSTAIEILEGGRPSGKVFIELQFRPDMMTNQQNLLNPSAYQVNQNQMYGGIPKTNEAQPHYFNNTTNQTYQPSYQTPLATGDNYKKQTKYSTETEQIFHGQQSANFGANINTGKTLQNQFNFN